MGAGKTTVGRRLAQLSGLDFVDSDDELQRRTGADIPLIFDIEGEEGFRSREKKLLDELTRREDLVLSTGGGAVLDPVNRARLAERGTVVYLCTSVDDQLERTRMDRRRPLLQTEDPRARLEALFAERDPLYREIADIVVDTAGRQSRRIAAELHGRLDLPDARDA